MDDDATKLRRDVWHGGAEPDLPEVDVDGARQQIWGRTSVDPEVPLASASMIIHDVWGAGAELETPAGGEARPKMAVVEEARAEISAGEEAPAEILVADEPPTEMPAGKEAPVATPDIAAVAWGPPPADVWTVPPPETTAPKVRDVMLRAHLAGGTAGGSELAEPSERESDRAEPSERESDRADPPERESHRADPPVVPDVWLQRTPNPSRRRRKTPQTWSIPLDRS